MKISWTLNLNVTCNSRRAALDWIREYGEDDGVIYFADDDNSYDVRIFEEIRNTELVSVFPVGLILKYGVSSPIVKNGKVTGFYDAFQAGRQFAMDMAGFAVSVKLFKSRPKATFPAKVGDIKDVKWNLVNIRTKISGFLS